MRVENPAYPGTPDINCTLGWIELKWVRSWPRRAGDQLKIRHFTQQQRIWLQRRWRKARGGVWLLLKVGPREWLLFDGDVASRLVGRATKSELRAAARWVWLDGLHTSQLIERLEESRAR